MRASPPGLQTDRFLLGTSFLKHIQFSQRGDTLTLRHYLQPPVLSGFHSSCGPKGTSEVQAFRNWHEDPGETKLIALGSVSKNSIAAALTFGKQPPKRSKG